MGYHAKILAHSSQQDGEPLLTVEARFPRIVIAEVVTHRTCHDNLGTYEMTFGEATTTEDFSKNSASSRAIPIQKMIQAVKEDPYIPERFSRNGGGMQGSGWLEGEEHERAKAGWLAARDAAVFYAEAMYAVGVHKQDVNRLLEPWAWVTQVLTATESSWHNFFALRCDAAAHPAFARIARMIYLLARKSKSKELDYGQWHLPFVHPDESSGFRWSVSTSLSADEIPDLIKISAARCAWVSYENHNKDATKEAHFTTFDRLLAANPKHASPVEHQATPMPPSLQWNYLRSNLNNWIQARKLIRGERIGFYAPPESEIASWGLSIS